MSDLFLQGIALRFDEIIDDGTKLLFLKSGCIAEPDNVSLMYDHDGKPWGADGLEIYVGEKSVAFRFAIPDSWSEQFKDQAGDVETYLAVSAGFTITKSESVTIDRVPVTVVSAATLREISLVSKDPAIKTTYARIVDSETCGDLETDYKSGRFELVGKVISLHRRAKANENDGIVQYNHATTPYDKAAAGELLPVPKTSS
jgi:phage head maturation protease